MVRWNIWRPKSLKKKEYDFSIDVWSLGVLLYELIHSHSPFVAKDLNINLLKILIYYITRLHGLIKLKII